ncbi:MAG: isochorismate synthase [Pegethrix bostrychoides GSE-TBD4-15B]|jgi:menaquinone-specific isochorismate synthase|uniref:isochorismate synthase n=1 Tax=Pegethrix bostrychoides GSE-TBD4-15B TaxID=2839662 RepID=A0A951PAS6_9CYAN|nr:isochorismate synthase [Pegethrix bostrychoides GSE-TBD4-15B]
MLCQSPFSQLNSSQDCKKLYQFLEFCKEQAVLSGQTKIASVALETAAIDPLTVLHRFAAGQVHFYFENRDGGAAVAAFDPIISSEISGAERFVEAQRFTQDCFARLLFNLPAQSWEQTRDQNWAAPCIFSSFSFFDQAGSAAPFAPATLFLPRWQIARQQNSGRVTVNWPIDAVAKISEITQTIWQQIQTIQRLSAEHFYLVESQLSQLNRWTIIDNHPFQTGVISALASIQNRAYKKLVLAHAIDVYAELPFQGCQSLHHLRQLHPDCAVFSVSNGRQSFIGASPERLLSIRQRHLITDALAGSASRGRTVSEDRRLASRLLQNAKEQHEHRLVVEFIAQELLELGLHPSYASRPSLRQLANIQHLHTPIQTQLPPDLHPMQLVAALHPTPAVAGMPRQTACEQILRYEPFDRSLYAAPLGWLDAEGNAEFIVGIRSALLDGHHARLYAGAGIVAGSDPEREFAEVKLKLQALLRGLV